jgi:hypothetical protein
MGLDLEYKKTVLADIAAIERADGGLYPAKTIYIQVSAARRRNGSFFMTHEMAKLESKHAVIIPKIEIIPEYLLIALEKAAPEFLRKYVGDNINIQMSALSLFEIEYHINRDTQRYIVDYMSNLQRAIDAEEAEIETIRDLKRYMLSKMLI